MYSSEILRQGACIDQPEVFDDALEVDTAKNICQSCPVRAMCAASLGPIAIELSARNRRQDQRVIAGKLYRFRSSELEIEIGQPLREASEEPRQLLSDLRASVQGEKITSSRSSRQLESLINSAAENYISKVTDDSQSPIDIKQGWQYIFRALRTSGRLGVQLYHDYPERFQAMATEYLDDVQKMRAIGIWTKPQRLAIFHDPAYIKKLIDHYVERSELTHSDTVRIIIGNHVQPEAAFANYFAHRDILNDHFRDNRYATEALIRRSCTTSSKLETQYASIITKSNRLEKLATSPRTSRYPLWILEGASSLSSESSLRTYLRSTHQFFESIATIYLDAPSRSGSSDLHQIVTGMHAPSTEDLAIANLVDAERGKDVLQYIDHLSAIDREVIGRTFGLDWLCEETGLSDDGLAKVLGVPDLMTYVAASILPKLRRAFVPSE